MSKAKASKNAFRRQQKKLRKEEIAGQPDTATLDPPPRPHASKVQVRSQDASAQEDASSRDYNGDDFDFPDLAEFQTVFLRFRDVQQEANVRHASDKQVIWEEDIDNIPAEDAEHTVPRKSKKARKRETKLSVAELKAMARKPELVEWTDADSSDPRLLLSIKSHRNVVPVPAHWSLKREYLSSKRGIEKPPFRLPKFIADTGIAEMRDAALEKQAEQTLKQKQRERVQPKMGRLDIDYTKLYNAFFKFQSKPELTRFGEVYYEGKEFETNLKHLRPGELSEELREALGMQPGFAPPWLLNMQRFGPPPSYPALRVPGVNAPPPPGASWGFGAGQYGKPPVDDSNKPLYGGDIFGLAQARQSHSYSDAIDRTLWGGLLAQEDEDDEGDDDDDVDDDEGGSVAESEDDVRGGGRGSPSGAQTGLPSDIGGMDSVNLDFNLRKRRGFETEESSHSRQAFRVIEEQSTNASGFLGSDKKYNIHNGQTSIPMLGSQDSRKRKAGDVDVSLDLDVLQSQGKLSKDEVAKQYEAQRQDPTKQWTVDQEDLSQMIAEESRKRMKKEQAKRDERRGGRT